MGRGRFKGGGSNSFDFSFEQQNQLRLRAKCTGDDHSSVKLSQTVSSKISLFLWTIPLSSRCCNPSRNRFNESLTLQQIFSFGEPGDVQCMVKWIGNFAFIQFTSTSDTSVVHSLLTIDLFRRLAFFFSHFNLLIDLPTHSRKIRLIWQNRDGTIRICFNDVTHVILLDHRKLNCRHELDIWIWKKKRKKEKKREIAFCVWINDAQNWRKIHQWKPKRIIRNWKLFHFVFYFLFDFGTQTKRNASDVIRRRCVCV